MPETPEDLYEQLWDAVAAVRDASPRVPNDAATDDIVNVAVNAIVRELRRLADEQAERAPGVPDDSNGVSIARLRARADELDG